MTKFHYWNYGSELLWKIYPTERRQTKERQCLWFVSLRKSLTSPGFRSFIFKMMVLEKTALSFPPVLVFCNFVTENLSPCPKSGCLLYTQMLHIPGCLAHISSHWPHLTHSSFSLIWPPTVYSDLNHTPWPPLYCIVFPPPLVMSYLLLMFYEVCPASLV